MTIARRGSAASISDVVIVAHAATGRTNCCSDTSSMSRSTIKPAPCVTANVGHGPDDEHQRLDTALQQRSRDNEAVATVVATPAEDGHPPLEPRLERCFNGRDDLASGVLHQHQGRDADVFNREPVGFAHLRGSQNSHVTRGSACPPELDERVWRVGLGTHARIPRGCPRW